MSNVKSMVPELFFFAALIGGFALVFLVGPRFLSRLLSRMLNGSDEKQQAAEQLAEHGDKAHATILSIDSTGTVVNRIYYQCDLQFRLRPCDGSPQFDGVKTIYVPVTDMPGVGDVWPGWYDPQDRATFVVGRPDFGDPKMVPILREFGIPNPAESAPLS